MGGRDAIAKEVLWDLREVFSWVSLELEDERREGGSACVLDKRQFELK